jgi:hypothetical protein
MRILSVPPDVVTPTASSGALKRERTYSVSLPQVYDFAIYIP